MPTLAEILRAPKTAAGGRELAALLVEPLRARVPDLRSTTDKPSTKSCPCQFLLQERFALPDDLRFDVRNVLRAAVSWGEGALAHRRAYLGFTATHACGEVVPNDTTPGLWWGLAMEPSASYRFEPSGPRKVFENLLAATPTDRRFAISEGPVPNKKQFKLIFLGRKLGIAEIDALSTTQIIETAARDLDELATALEKP